MRLLYHIFRRLARGIADFCGRTVAGREAQAVLGAEQHLVRRKSRRLVRGLRQSGRGRGEVLGAGENCERRHDEQADSAEKRRLAAPVRYLGGLQL